MTYHIDYAYTCHAGKVRPNNEDNFWCCGEHLPVSNHGTEEIRTGIRLRESLPVMAVFDGMGGESQGEMAAWLASDSLEHFYRENKGMLRKAPELFLTEACKNMNQAVCDYGREQHPDSPDHFRTGGQIQPDFPQFRPVAGTACMAFYPVVPFRTVFRHGNVGIRHGTGIRGRRLDHRGSDGRTRTGRFCRGKIWNERYGHFEEVPSARAGCFAQDAFRTRSLK